MEFLSAYGLFAAKAFTLVFCIAAIILLIAAVSSKDKHSQTKGKLEITKLNDIYEGFSEQLKLSVLPEKSFKEQKKKQQKQAKQHEKQLQKEAKNKNTEAGSAPRLFVLEFNGDVKASAVENLRQEISAVLLEAKPEDEILVSLESPGGMVHAYGLASSQLQRIRDAGIPLTVGVDKVAASGGYMMACIANKIIAAPFAIVGSIGVVAQLPNLHRLLKKHDVDYELFTAGKYKRTVTVFGENTQEGKQKFQDDLEITHELFKQFVAEHRPGLAIEEVANGDIWYGSKALEKGLVDEVSSTDAYLMQKHFDGVELYKVCYKKPKKFAEKVGFTMESSIKKAIISVFDDLQQKRWFS